MSKTTVEKYLDLGEVMKLIAVDLLAEKLVMSENETEAVKNNLSAYVTQLDGEMERIQENIASLETQIEEKTTQIVQTEAQLNEAIEIENAQYESMKKRIKFMYEKGDDYYLELLFSADSVPDMLNKADYIEQLSAYDRKMLYSSSTVTSFTIQAPFGSCSLRKPTLESSCRLR